MTCTPANKPQMIEVTDLIYSPADFERRFLTGWWTRGLVPLDSFTTSNWAGLIIPKSIFFEGNSITIEFPGRWWDEDDCQRSMPKVSILIQYLCKSGRSYLHSQVKYGKKDTYQVYAGNNGARKYSRVPLEKLEEQCSIEQTADIPVEKADVIDIRHLADWLVTMISAPGVISNDPTEKWLEMFSDYTDSDFSWVPCAGCIFPVEDYSIPAKLSDDTMLQLESRLIVQNVKALGDVIILSSVPSTFNVPMCLNNTYLEVTLPDLASVMHMRTFFSCDSHLFDQYTTIPVKPSDILKCFEFPEPDKWPSKEDPRWKDVCVDNYIKSCTLGWGFSQSMNGPSASTPTSSFGGVSFALCSGSYYNAGGQAKMPAPNTYVLNMVNGIREEWNEIVCVVVQGYGPPVQNISCQRVRLYTEEIMLSQATSDPIKLRNETYAANPNWNCNSSFNGPSPPPPKPNIGPEDDPQGPNGDGDCYLEGQISYVLNLNTILGSIYFERTLPFRAKVPKGTANLGPISGSISGSTLNISTSLGGNFTVSLGPIIDGFNAVGKTISAIVPATFGLRNVRLIC